MGSADGMYGILVANYLIAHSYDIRYLVGMVWYGILVANYSTCLFKTRVWLTKWASLIFMRDYRD